MAVTKIWDIRGNLSNSLRYVQNAEKTYNPDFDSDLQTLGRCYELCGKRGEDREEVLRVRP